MLIDPDVKDWQVLETSLFNCLFYSPLRPVGFFCSLISGIFNIK